MTPVALITLLNLQQTFRRSLLGARGDDPIVPDRRRPRRWRP